MTPTPIDQIPVPVLESIENGSSYLVTEGRWEPSCGCQRSLTNSYYLCPYHDGMTDGFHAAQQLNREKT